MKNILFIHGAGASPRSFNFLINALPKHTSILPSYNPDESVHQVSERIARSLDGLEDISIVGHSLGGIIGLELASLPNISRLFTSGSPFGGHPAAVVMSMWSNQVMFKDLLPYGKTIRSLQKKWTAANKRHLALVTTRGLPFFDRENDGVVTVGSQTALVGPEYRYLDINHFEVLLEQDIARTIENFIWNET